MIFIMWRLSIFEECLLLRMPYLDEFVLQDGSCNGLQHYAALGRDRVST